jgi:anti-sigma factor RsiW
MDHVAAQDLFSAYAEGELTSAHRAALEEHLAACIQCRTSLESFRGAMGSLGRLKTGAPPRLLDGVKQQINRRSRGRFFGKRWLLFGRFPFEWVSLAMIVAMLLYYVIELQGSPTGVKPAP